MKRLLSLFLALILLLSGCAFEIDTSETRPYVTVAPTEPEITQGPTEPEKVVIPQLVGKQVESLAETDDYKVIIFQKEYSSLAAGTILRQDPEGGSWVDKGTSVYVVVSMDQREGSEIAPAETEPSSDLPEQTDPPIPEQEIQETEPGETQPTEPPATEPEPYLDPNGSYTTRDDVALFIHLYGRLPNNFITKKQAENQYGWDGGSLSQYGMCIGGDRYYNREGKLPGGYTYYECDIDTLYSSKRGAKRLVFTYSGRIYYTSDHYDTFIRLY